MIQFLKTILFSVSLCAFYSCNMSDGTESLFGDYVYGTESSHNHFIIGGRNNIPPDVVAYDFDDNFLIAQQKPFSDVLLIKKANEILDSFEGNKLKENDSTYILLKKNGADGSFDSNFKAGLITAKWMLSKEDVMYKKYLENSYLYWILIISNDNLIGPLTQLEFDATRKELGVSDKLKLD